MSKVSWYTESQNQQWNTKLEEMMIQLNDALITGYEVTRFGIPMIGQYVNKGKGGRVAISPAVPDAQYRITAWALGNGRRSATPAVEDATIREASECDLHKIYLEGFAVTENASSTSQMNSWTMLLSVISKTFYLYIIIWGPHQ